VKRIDTRGPHAILIDLDGTLVDTVEVWRTAYLRLAAELGTGLPEGFWPSIAGRSMQGSLQVLGAAATAHDPDRLIERLVDLAAEHLRDGGGSGWSWLPGAQELLEMLWAAPGGPATGLVTSAWHAFTDPLLAIALTGRAHTFGAIVCGDDVAHPKPSPDAYLRAAELLGVAPTDCLVIEDSPTGVAAAESAGMVVLAVPHAGPVAAAPGRAVRDHLGGITREDLVALYARLRSGASS
jgi:beta-phosphoglucomutase-like phosphatase (HAD superfamily)